MYVISIKRCVPVAQRIRRETTNLKIAGSNLVGDTTYIIFCVRKCVYPTVWFYGVIGYFAGLRFPYSGFKSR